MQIKYKGYTIDAELGDDPKVDVTISCTRRGREYWGSIGCAEHEGLSDKDGLNTIQVPTDVIDRACDLEEELLEKHNND
jgi:hypothetical protein